MGLPPRRPQTRRRQPQTRRHSEVWPAGSATGDIYRERDIKSHLHYHFNIILAREHASRRWLGAVVPSARRCRNAGLALQGRGDAELVIPMNDAPPNPLTMDCMGG